MSLRLFVLLSGLLAACGQPAPPRPGANTLVLEVGGAHGSLRRSLVASGVAVEASHRLRADPAVEAVGPASGGGDPAPGAQPALRPEEPPQVSPQTPPPNPQDTPPADDPATPPPEPEHFVVRLQRGQTLIHLAKKHLGNGNRYREIMTCNGWNDADTRRLKEGQEVKIPRSPASR